MDRPGRLCRGALSAPNAETRRRGLMPNRAIPNRGFSVAALVLTGSLGLAASLKVLKPYYVQLLGLVTQNRFCHLDFPFEAGSLRSRVDRLPYYLEGIFRKP
jgi:hypothetical protein